ncbi:PAS domain-containing protein, partial [Deinococcus pimensis]|uniref:PAS domain-containing protein n=1 Tax=Deinococcus pimensis TaxID=309888 RepID=UPI00146FBC5E
MTTSLPPDSTRDMPDLRAFLDALPDPCFRVDAAWRVTYVNLAALAFVGREEASIVGHDLWTTLPETRGRTFERELRRARSEGVTVEFEVPDPSGQRRLSVRAFPHEGGVGVICRDVPRPSDGPALRLAERR